MLFTLLLWILRKRICLQHTCGFRTSNLHNFFFFSRLALGWILSFSSFYSQLLNVLQLFSHKLHTTCCITTIFFSPFSLLSRLNLVINSGFNRLKLLGYEEDWYFETLWNEWIFEMRFGLSRLIFHQSKCGSLSSSCFTEENWHRLRKFTHAHSQHGCKLSCLTWDHYLIMQCSEESPRAPKTHHSLSLRLLN